MMREIEERRSIRKYEQTPLKRQDILTILEAGRQAPSGKNKQPWHFVVVTEAAKEELVQQMERGIKREAKTGEFFPNGKQGLPDALYTAGIMKQAPVIILVLDTEYKDPFIPVAGEQRITEIVNTQSIGAAIENMILQAQSLGIGSLWIANTYYAYPEISAWLGREEQVVAALALGYAKEAPKARPRKASKEIVTFLDGREENGAETRTEN